MIPITRLRTSSIAEQYHLRRVFAKRYTVPAKVDYFKGGFSMKRIWVLATFLLAVGVGASALDCKEAIGEVRDSWITHWKAKQLDEVMELYVEDATLLSEDGHLHVGRTQIRAYFKTLMDSGTASSAQSAGVVCSGDAGYDTGTYINTGGGTMMKGNMTMKGNAAMKGGGAASHGNYAVALRREAGKWKIVQHASVHSE